MRLRLATTTRIDVVPAVLAWARSSARLPSSEAARRLGVSPERIAEWESGQAAPTINQLRNMAEAYHRPLAALFMSAPPAGETVRRLPDFRRAETRAEVEPRSLQKAIFRAMRQQDALREIAAELGSDESTLVFPVTLAVEDDSEISGAKLREVLRLNEVPMARLSRPEVLLRDLVALCEGLNVTVIQVQRLDVTVMRGFSLGQGTCPVVALNGADWPRGKVFTLLHELAHVGFHSNGLCDLEDYEKNEALEAKCNEIAAAALMPRNRVIELARSSPELIDVDYARAIGSAFGVSAEAALLRLVKLGVAEWSDYWRLKPEFDEAYRAHKSDEKENANPNSPLYYQLKARDLGRSFVRTVLHAYSEDVLSSRDLASLLEVKYDQVPKLASRVGEDLS